MKKLLAVIFIAAAILCGCANNSGNTPEPALSDNPAHAETTVSVKIEQETSADSAASTETASEPVTESTTSAEPTEAETDDVAEDVDNIVFSDDGFDFSTTTDLEDEDLIYQFGIDDENAKKLIEVLFENTADPEEKLYDFVIDDYDLDGNYEAFAVKGRRSGYDIEGDIYFVTVEGVEKINGETYYLDYDRNPVFDLGDRKLYRVWHVFTTGRSAYVYGVKDGKWYEHEISQRGQDLERMGLSDNFTIVNGSDYDIGYSADDNMTTGHTWKTYYLYWNGEEFREYGGIEITEEQFLKCEGAQHILDLAEENDCFVSNILYRGNGLINVNLTDRDFYGNEDYYYFSLILEDGKLEYLRTDGNSSNKDDEFEYNACSGIMYAAFLEDIADYPESFPIE